MRKRIAPYALAIALCFIIFSYCNKNNVFRSDSKISGAQLFFAQEKDYIDFIHNNVSFDGIDLKVIMVSRGDNFWLIAKKFGVNIDTLIGANPHWESLVARVSQRVIVPSEKGVLHCIMDFREIDELAETYNVPQSDIVIQKLPVAYRLYYHFLSDRKPIAVFIRNTKPSTNYMTLGMAEQFKEREMFRSPLGGRLSSFYGQRVHPIFHYNSFHNGIDIASAYGIPVGASRAGRVTSCGWMGGYGYAVLIEHDQGYRTLYGHLSRICVRQGQMVNAGRLIGRVGSTGLSTGPHLHFTLWKKDRLINPLKVLW